MNIIQVVGLVLVGCVAAPFLVGGIYLLVRDARRTGEWWLVGAIAITLIGVGLVLWGSLVAA